jgi:outer membrane putative beta-barrel porin/alpha-amylase
MAKPTLAASMVAVIAAFPGLIASGHATCSGGAASPIATDRPAVTDSSVVVPCGSLQAENGFAETSSQGQRTFDGPETLLRFGVASKTELRFTAPNYFGQVGMTSGVGDLAIGMKQQLGPTHGFDVSLVLSLSLPTGASAITSHGYDPFVQLPWSRALSSNWTAAGMLSVYWPTEQRRRDLTGETTFLMDRQFTKAWDAFIEYVGDFPERGGPRHLVHFGTTYKLTPHQQLDLHGGFGLSSAAVDQFIGAGYSFRFDSLLR